MFRQTFIEVENNRRRVCTLAASLAMQSAAACGMIAAPLVFGLELPLDHLMRQALVFVPPAPPQARTALPRAPAAVAPPPRFRADVLQAPRLIPDRVALIEDLANASSLVPAEFAGLHGIAGGIPGGVPGGVIGVPGIGSQAVLPPAPLRVGGRVQAAKLVHRIAPVYPEEAIREDISGSVHLEATIGNQGEIRGLKVLSGHPVLTAAAVEAVRQWRYRPTLLNGNAVEVISQIEVIFALAVPEEETGNTKNPKKKRQ